MSTNTNRKRFTTGVSLEPEVVRYLDALAVQSGFNRSWVLNTIVREYLRFAQERGIVPLASRDAIIKL